MNRFLRYALLALLIGTATFYGQNAARDTSNPEKSLLGHWVTDDGENHYYISAGKLILTGDNRVVNMTYTVLESAPKERRLRIRALMPSGLGHDKNLEFSPDSSSLVSTTKDFEKTDYKHPFKWIYVDAKQAP